MLLITRLIIPIPYSGVNTFLSITNIIISLGIICHYPKVKDGNALVTRRYILILLTKTEVGIVNYESSIKEKNRESLTTKVLIIPTLINISDLQALRSLTISEGLPNLAHSHFIIIIYIYRIFFILLPTH